MKIKTVCRIGDKGVNLAPSRWASPSPLFIKPPFREAPNEGAKKKP